ncbi:hypothetical protein A3733_11470 [Pseudoalteromonas shioyasakiensis]|nr:hypothetical protein A3733_11470 [Pseudoalteromonas shioyasakiensis]
MTEHEEIQKREAEFIKLIIIIAVFALLIVSTTFGIFFDFTPSKELKTWVDTATIFTGVATPILSTVSVFLLYFVLKDNRRELAETKRALSEQSDTQNFSVIKDAVFDVAEKAKEQMLEEVKVISDGDGDTYLISSKSDDQTFLDFDWYDETTESYEIKTLEEVVKDYFIFMASNPCFDDLKESTYKNIIYTEPFFTYIDKVKTISLFLKSIKSKEYREIIEITLFTKLTIFSWLLFVEIAHHLYKTASKEDKATAELVFEEMAGLICRQLKEQQWIRSLSDEALTELKTRKLIPM